MDEKKTAGEQRRKELLYAPKNGWDRLEAGQEAALRAYQGRAFYDGTAGLEPEVLDRLRRTYGLILL